MHVEIDTHEIIYCITTHSFHLNAIFRFHLFVYNWRFFYRTNADRSNTFGIVQFAWISLKANHFACNRKRTFSCLNFLRIAFALHSEEWWTLFRLCLCAKYERFAWLMCMHIVFMCIWSKCAEKKFACICFQTVKKGHQSISAILILAVCVRSSLFCVIAFFLLHLCSFFSRCAFIMSQHFDNSAIRK